MIRFHSFLILFSLLALSVGCGKNIPVKGSVSFEDGSPLECGTIFFQSDTCSAKGEIEAGGNFVIGSLKDRDGLPPGRYKVFIKGAVAIRPGFVPKLGSDDLGYAPVIDENYSSAQTTPLEYDIDKKSFFEIKIPPFQRK